MLRLEKSPTFASLETTLSSFVAAREKFIQIPGSLDRAGMFGVDAASCQLLLTLSHENPALLLRLSAAVKDVPEHIESLSRNLFGFAALTCFPKIIDAQSQLVGHSVIQRCVDRCVAAMDSGPLSELIRGRSMQFTCTSSGSREFIRRLYAVQEVRGLQPCGEFQKLTQDMVAMCGAGSALTARQVDGLGELLFELFRNTDEHGQLDEHGDQKEPPRFRSILASYREIQISDTPKYFGNELAFQSYIGRLVARAKKNKKLRFFELSVVDNGPGLAARWLGGNDANLSRLINSISLEDELKAVHSCFAKYNTTKSDAGAGQGLTKVVNRLSSLDAFFRLRTGRLALYQSFYSKDLAAGKAAFNPVQVNSQRSLRRMAGTCYTICIPLNSGDPNAA